MIRQWFDKKGMITTNLTTGIKVVIDQQPGIMITPPDFQPSNSTTEWVIGVNPKM